MNIHYYYWITYIYENVEFKIYIYIYNIDGETDIERKKVYKIKSYIYKLHDSKTQWYNNIIKSWKKLI